MEKNKIHRLMGALIVLMIIMASIPFLIKKNELPQTSIKPRLLSTPNSISGTAVLSGESVRFENAVIPNISPKNTPTSLPRASFFSEKKAWLIQLGVFRKVQHANQLIKELKHAGYDCSKRLIQSKNGQTLTSVIIGPIKTQNEAKLMAFQIQKIFHLHGLIIHHT